MGSREFAVRTKRAGKDEALGGLRVAAGRSAARTRSHPLLQLQHAVGNRATSGLVQAALLVSQPGDRCEQEADRVAAEVAERFDASAFDLDPKPSQTIDRGLSTLVSRSAEGLRGIDAARGSGQALPDGVRAAMEPLFGADFRGVRLHADAQAHALSSALEARAFTTGRDVFFGHGQYQPTSRRGVELLAHELTHVIQQSRLLGARGVQRAIAYVTPAPPGQAGQLNADLAAPGALTATRFVSGEVLSNTPGAQSITAHFTHALASDFLMDCRIEWNGTDIGYLRPLGKIKPLGFDPGVKMHLVNSFLHPGANGLATNWTYGHNDLNHAHDQNAERIAKSWHPQLAGPAVPTLAGGQPVHAIAYQTEVQSRAATNRTPADLATDIRSALGNRMPANYTCATQPVVDAQVTIKGQTIANYHTTWSGAIGQTVASQVDSFLRVFGLDAGGANVVSQDVGLVPAVDLDPVQYRVVIDAQDLALAALQPLVYTPAPKQPRTTRSAAPLYGSSPKKLKSK